MRVRALYPFFQALLKYSERFKEESGFIACGRGGRGQVSVIFLRMPLIGI